jgi:hypothetical protein
MTKPPLSLYAGIFYLAGKNQTRKGEGNRPKGTYKDNLPGMQAKMSVIVAGIVL